MANFEFTAPSLYEPDAEPDPAEGYMHEDPARGARLARQKRLALWLKAKLEAKGVAASSVSWDESGWAMSVNGKDGFVMVILDSYGGGDEPFTLVVAQMSNAKSEYERTFAAFEAILRDSPETDLLEVIV